MVDKALLRDAERVVRAVMIVILPAAGTGNLLSNGGFFHYYSTLFRGDLRISLPPLLIDL